MARRRFGLISDTHGFLHPEVFDVFDGVEAILHAGDVCGADILTELETIAPTHAVAGNCDPPGVLPSELVVDLPLGRVVIVHSHLVAPKSAHRRVLVARLSSHQPRIILYGHTHEVYRQLLDDVWVVNPGASGASNNGGRPTVMTLEWDEEADDMIFQLHPLSWPLGHGSGAFYG